MGSPKILIVCTEDWFFRSHFLPLGRAALSMSGAEAVVVCSSGEATADLEAAGLRVVPFDFSRQKRSPLALLNKVRQLRAVIAAEKPDLVHFISLKPILIGGLATRGMAGLARAFHLTGLGYVAAASSIKARAVRAASLRLVVGFLNSPRSWLILENPDDQALLEDNGWRHRERVTITGGAGVDPDAVPALEPVDNDRLEIGFVGRLVWSKGVDVAIAAMDLLKAEGVAAHLNLYGMPDAANPRSVTEAELGEWNARDDVTWHGFASNMTEVWRSMDVAVVPSRGGEGLPRALLEAASSQRAIVSSDVPGCRHFIEPETSGLLVPPGDAQALAGALKRVAESPELRLRLAEGARERLLNGYTEDDVSAAIRDSYERVLALA